MSKSEITTKFEKESPVAGKMQAMQEEFESVSALTGQIASQKSQISAPKRDSFLSFTMRTLGELRYVKFALASFVINNLRRRYQRSVLGFAWSLLNPLLMMIVLTTVFSIIFNRDPKTYGLFIFTGMLPWTFISESIVSGCSSITAAENFMKKVYIPKIFFPLVTVSTELINFGLSLFSMIILGLFLGLQLHWTLLLLPVAMAITFVFTFGIALSLAVGTVYFRDIAHFVRVILTCFFYVIPIIYPLSAVPKKYEIFFQINPFTHFINLFRDLIYQGICPTAQEWLIPLFLSFIALFCGFFILKQKERDIIFRL